MVLALHVLESYIHLRYTLIVIMPYYGGFDYRESHMYGTLLGKRVEKH